MDALLRDFRYALRGLRKAPGFTLVAIVTLGLGIGANSGVFSLVNAVLFRPLPVERPEELVNVYGQTATSSDHNSNSYPNFVDYQAQSQTLSGMLAFTNFFANLSIDGSAELVIGEVVSEGYFAVLGVEAAEGRTFAAEEFAAVGAGPVAVLSHAFWQARFAGDPGAVGRTFRMNGVPYTVVGVAPEGFGGMMPAVSAQMWIPLSMVEEVEPLGSNWNSGPLVGATRLERRGQHFLWIKGRLAPGATLEQARAELEAITANLARLHPETNARMRVAVLASDDVVVNPDFDGTLRPAGMVLLGAVGLVLLVACANLANMMTARQTGRRREMALRLAIGADRRQLVRQMVVESLTLSLAGGAVAVLIAYAFAGAVARFQPPLPIELALDVSPDGRVLAFTTLVATLTGLAFGLLPALRASRPDLVPALKDVAGPGRRGRRLDPRDALVVVQVAVSLVLLVGGALMVRSLGAGARVDFGYDVDRMAHLALAMDMNGYDAERAGIFLGEATRRLRARPDVEAVGRASRIPLELNNNGFGLFIDGHQSSPDDAPYALDGARVDEGYFGALGLEIVSGRGIEAADRLPDAEPVAVVSRALASRYWPEEDPVGRAFRLSWDGRPYRVVGVVEDYKVDTPGEDPTPYLHLPLGTESTYGNFVVRTAVPAAPLVPALEAELRTLDPELVFVATGTMRQLAEVRLFPVRAGAWLIGVFGVLALLVASVGLYGVVSYSVSRRVREMGIRKALGAEKSGVVTLILRQGMLLVLVGGVVGLVLALLASRALSAALLVDAYDPVSFAAAFAALAAVGALANWVPARRAAAVDPVVALKSD